MSIDVLLACLGIKHQFLDSQAETVYEANINSLVHGNVKDVDLHIRPGKVLGLLWENGAEKPTLMNVLCGLYAPTSGMIVVDGLAVDFAKLGYAISTKFVMVHQHFILIPVFSIAENVVSGVEPTGRIDHLDLSGGSRISLRLEVPSRSTRSISSVMCRATISYHWSKHDKQRLAQ